jgi:hypothetical protein
MNYLQRSPRARCSKFDACPSQPNVRRAKQAPRGTHGTQKVRLGETDRDNQILGRHGTFVRSTHEAAAFLRVHTDGNAPPVSKE